MWIVCAGARRSGSTLQYNIISRIIEVTNQGKRITHFRPEEFRYVKGINKDYNGYKVIKTHVLTDELMNEINNKNAIIFHTYRDIRDVVVSYINKGWVNKKSANIVKCVSNYLNEYTNWSAINENFYSRKYEDFAFDIGNEIKFILRILNLKLDKEKAETIIKELNIENLKENQDKIAHEKMRMSYGQTFHYDTLIHTNHINNGTKNQFLKSLTKSQISLIESIAWRYLIEHQYVPDATYPNNFISFSQHADDYIAWQLLGKKRKGLVVEVGAFDGIHLSNSYYLNLLGWKSVCIEPNPDIFKYLVKNRPTSANINKAVVSNEKTKVIDFYVEKTGVLSGCSIDENDIKERYKNRRLEFEEPKKIVVPASTLNSIFRNLSLGKDHIDIMSIDVEGFEIEVLKGLDIERHEIQLFIIEANTTLERKTILNYFKAFHDYMHIGDNYQNMFIIRKQRYSKKTLKSLDYYNYVQAKQYHPTDLKLSINSTKPNFKRLNKLEKIRTYFRYNN